jgi:hypothetical protein
MIAAQTDLSALIAALEKQAALLAQAHAQQQTDDPARWRQADLLWPLFGADMSGPDDQAKG